MFNSARGWLFSVPATHSIAFFPEDGTCLEAECLPWESLLCNETALKEFVDNFQATQMLTASSCFCFYLESPPHKLSEWFENLLRTTKNSAQKVLS